QLLYEAPEFSESFFAAYSSDETPLGYYSTTLASSGNPLLALAMYLFRCLGNAFSSAVRFSAVSEYGEWALLGTGYGVLGLALGVGLYLTAQSLLRFQNPPVVLHETFKPEYLP